MKRPTLGTYGRRGDRVRVVHDTKAKRVVVYYRDRAGLPHKKLFEPTKAGKSAALAWAEMYHAERATQGTAPVIPQTTTRALWQAFTDSPQFHGRRKATRRSHETRWALWQAFIKEETVAASVTLLDVDRFIVRMRKVNTRRKVPRELNQVRQILQVVRAVYNYGQSRELIAKNALALFRWETPKGQEPIEPAEYSVEEFDKLLAELSPQDGKRWRAHVALLLAGASGQRAQAIRHLRWRDIDLAAGVITWPGEYQKQGVPLERAITADIRSALFTAAHWRTAVAEGRQRPRGAKSGATKAALESADWVLFAEHRRDRPVSYQTLHTQMTNAETRAGVKHLEFRALHGMRRMVVGEIGEATGDLMRGLEYVGDKDAKQLKSYDRRMQGRVDNAAAVLFTAMEGKR